MFPTFSIRIALRVAIVLIVLLTTLPSLAAPTMTASLSRASTTVRQTVIATVIVNDGTPDSPPVLQPVAGVTVGFSGSRQQAFSANGRTVKQSIYTYQIVPGAVGTIKFAPIYATVKGTRLAAVLPQLTVAAAPVTPPMPTVAQPVKYGFFKTVVSKNEAFVGELLPIEFQIYYMNGRNINIPKLNSSDVLFISPPRTPTVSHRNVVFEGRNYRLTSLGVVTSPTRVGELLLGPASCQMQLVVPSPHAPTQVQLVVTNLIAPAVSLNILPLPEEGKPDDFSGPVGYFHSLVVKPSKTNVNVGDPITLTFSVTGRGVFQQVELALGDDWREFKSYPPTSSVRFTDRLQTQGIKTFEQIVSPKNADITELPEVRFSFFEPVSRAYQTLTNSQIPIVVMATGSGPAQPTVVAAPSEQSETPVASDIVHIKPHFGSAAANVKPLVARPVFWLAHAFPLGVWLALLGWRKREEWIVANPSLLRRRNAKRRLAKVLKQAEHLAQANDEKAFHRAAFQAMRERIGLMLDRSPHGITEDVIESEMTKAGVTDSQLADLREFFQLCNETQYAPGKISGNTSQILAQLKRLNAELPAGRTKNSR